MENNYEDNVHPSQIKFTLSKKEKQSLVTRINVVINKLSVIHDKLTQMKLPEKPRFYIYSAKEYDIFLSKIEKELDLNRVRRKEHANPRSSRGNVCR